MLNERDQKELDERLKDPEFSRLYTELTFFRALHYPGLNVQIWPLNGTGKDNLLSPKDLDRRDLTFRIVPMNSKTIPLDVACILAEKLNREAEAFANRLAYFFPSAQHRHWSIIFKLMAINGHGYAGGLAQRQNGGAPKGTRRETEKHYHELAEWYYKSGLSQEEFCNYYKSISRSRLNRALKFVSKKR